MVVALAEVGPVVAETGGTVGRTSSTRARGPSSKAWPLARSVTTGLALTSLAFLLNISVLGRMVHWSAQHREYAQFRKELAFGTAPVGPLDHSGRLLRLGVPVALLEVPALHLREVVGEGTSSHVLMFGPGHLRSTVLPGQEGTSVILGRAAAYGGPFGNLGHVPIGAIITTTTGAGTVKFKVIDVRYAGNPLPPVLRSGQARVTLVSGAGAAFFPHGVVRVDADSEGTAQPASPLAITSVPHDQQPMGTDTGDLLALILWLEALLVVVACAAWGWFVWGAARTWVIAFPIAVVLGYYVSAGIMTLIPNLT